jgi:hypothetical protein
LTRQIAATLVLWILSIPPIFSGGVIVMRGSAGAGDPAADWSASFVAWWSLDEASGTRVANSSTSCGSAGSDCDLADNNTVTNDTTNKQEGTASASFASANDEHLDCADSTCDELDHSGGTHNSTWGCWWRSSTATNQVVIDNLDLSGGGKGGYQMTRQTADERIWCRVADNNSNYGIFSVTGTAPEDDEWYHLVCRVIGDTADTFQTFIGGELSSSSPQTIETGGDGESFYVGTIDGGSESMDGELDECFVIHDYLSDAEICRVCSCQIDGSLCTCDGTTYVDDGRNSSDCGSCTLPDCDATAP